MEPTTQDAQRYINATLTGNDERCAFGLGHMLSSTAVTGATLVGLFVLTGSKMCVAVAAACVVGGWFMRNIDLSDSDNAADKKQPRSISIEYARSMLDDDMRLIVFPNRRFRAGLKNGILKGNVLSSFVAAGAIVLTAGDAAWEAGKVVVPHLFTNPVDALCDGSWGGVRPFGPQGGAGKAFVDLFKKRFSETKPLRCEFITPRVPDAAARLIGEHKDRQQKANTFNFA